MNKGGKIEKGKDGKAGKLAPVGKIDKGKAEPVVKTEPVVKMRKSRLENMICNLLLYEPEFALMFNTDSWINLCASSPNINQAALSGCYSGLMPHQIIHFREMREGIWKYKRMVDTSMMGCGKTFVACALARDLHVPMVVFAPGSVRHNWNKAMNHFKLPSSMLDFHSYSELQCEEKPFLRNFFPMETSDIPEETKLEIKASPDWMQVISKGVLLIFDECHWLKNPSDRSALVTILSRTMLEEGHKHCYLLCLSATPFDKKEHAARLCRPLCIIKQANLASMNLQTLQLQYEGLQDLIDFCKEIAGSNDVVVRRHWGTSAASQTAYDLVIRYVKPALFHSMPKVDMRFASDSANFFGHITGQDLITVQAGVQQLSNAIIAFASNQLTQGQTGQIMASITKGMSTIELGKVNMIVRLTKEILDHEENTKVVLFMNYIETIDTLKAKLAQYSPLVIKGATKQDLRPKMISDFQESSTRCRLLIANLNILSIGVDLDDQNGEYPRKMFISPSYNIINLHQATGRLNRAQTQSAPVIRFVYAAKTSKEVGLLDRLAEKSSVVRSGLDYDVKLLGDYDVVYERPEDDPKNQPQSSTSSGNYGGGGYKGRTGVSNNNWQKTTSGRWINPSSMSSSSSSSSSSTSSLYNIGNNSKKTTSQSSTHPYMTVFPKTQIGNLNAVSSTSSSSSSSGSSNSTNSSSSISSSHNSRNIANTTNNHSVPDTSIPEALSDISKTMSDIVARRKLFVKSRENSPKK